MAMTETITIASTETETRLYFIGRNFRKALSLFGKYTTDEESRIVDSLKKRELNGISIEGHVSEKEYAISLDIMVDWVMHDSFIEKGELRIKKSMFRDEYLSHDVYAMITEFRSLLDRFQLYPVITFYVSSSPATDKSEYQRVCRKLGLSERYSDSQLVEFAFGLDGGAFDVTETIRAEEIQEIYMRLKTLRR